MTSHQIDISDYEKDPRLFLFTSLTAGSSHIITATSRMETILKANKIPFQAIDLATDEKARRLWQRRARERKLPGLVKEGFVLGDLDEIEEWNEFGELKENIGNVPSSSDAASHTVKTGVNIAPPIPVNPTATRGTTNLSQPPVNKAPKPGVDESKFRALPGAAEIAARNKPKPAPEQVEGKSVGDENAAPKAAAESTSVIDEPAPKAVESMTSAPADKEESINAAKKLLKETQAGKEDHLSAPPSAMQSGAVTPAEKDKEEAINPAKKLLGEEQTTGKDDHLSAPPSAMQSGTATPNPESIEIGKDAATGEGEGEQKLMHRGSEVKDVPSEEVKQIEGESSLAEADEEEAAEGKEEQKGAAAVEASDAGEGKAAEEIKEQSAKEGDDAGKSVGD